MEENAICYSRDWDTSAKRKQEAEAAAAEAQRKRAGVIGGLLTDAEKKADAARTGKAPVQEPAHAK